MSSCIIDTCEEGLVSTGPESECLLASPYIAKWLITWSNGWIIPFYAKVDLFVFVTRDLTSRAPGTTAYWCEGDGPGLPPMTLLYLIELRPELAPSTEGSGSRYIVGYLFSMKD